MSKTNEITVRPSALPKLALCGQFESAPGTSEAAARGLRVDALFRQMWETGEIPRNADEEEVRVAFWAVNILAKIRNNHQTTTDEEKCKVWVSALKKEGTMDAVNVNGQWLADLKTGQMHGYKEQMAAYALGCMEQYQVTEWTAYLLFADQKEVVKHHFTASEAMNIVHAVLENVGAPPTENDYCQWCAKSLTCGPRVHSQELALATVEATTFSLVLDNPDLLGKFLTRAKVFDEFREVAKERAKELIEQGQDVKGWRLSKPRTSEMLDAAAQLSSGIPLASLIMAHGPISAKKVRELGAIDEALVITKQTRPILTSK
jgi:hypothetical protein